MNIQDNDFKYIMQNTGSVFLGARFSYDEILEQEMAPFKLKTIISQYILKDVDSSTTLESHFYYMTADSLSYKTFKELKVKIKVSIPQEHKGFGGKVSYRYEEKVYSLKAFEELNLAQKKKMGIIIREIIISKLGLLSFAV